jgi:ATP-dependent phosphoenolpyruvate carboxykinase
VRGAAFEKAVWWESVNVPIDPSTYSLVRERVRDYLNICEPLLLR